METARLICIPSFWWLLNVKTYFFAPLRTLPTILDQRHTVLYAEKRSSLAHYCPQDYQSQNAPRPHKDASSNSSTVKSDLFPADPASAAKRTLLSLVVLSTFKSSLSSKVTYTPNPYLHLLRFLPHQVPPHQHSPKPMRPTGTWHRPPIPMRGYTKT